MLFSHNSTQKNSKFPSTNNTGYGTLLPHNLFFQLFQIFITFLRLIKEIIFSFQTFINPLGQKRRHLVFFLISAAACWTAFPSSAFTRINNFLPALILFTLP